ncbi:uncharacterized protein LOC120007670 isoform X2 [Tripterygium wilfordii]|uniref:uncharacterized protein LOC120007670 isoform X2 n=1 Tax=Tripterygium wilfordii TaxID=458696 RepID=UPI0018F7F153|nr:uncharacterized protein LOC120007670 isoform X2 [Tripterygium wilfordii]
MREGLRSGSSAARSKKDDASNSPALAKRNVYNTRQKGSDLNKEKSTGLEAEKGTNVYSTKEGDELEDKSNGYSPKEAIEPDKDEALTCQELIQKKVDSAVQLGSDVNKETNSEQISCSKSEVGTIVSSPREEDEVEENNNASSPNEGVGLERREGSQNAECRRDCNVDGGEVAVEFAENARKRTRLYGGENFDENSDEKKKAAMEGFGLDSKMQTAGRILRSASRSRSDGETGEFGDDVVGKTCCCGDDPEKERAEFETAKGNQSDGEVRNILKQKSESRRDPKMQGEAKMKESDQSDGEMRKKLGESCRKKRGRPRKVQVEVKMKESDQSVGEMRKKLRKSCGKKRGRPRKVQVEVETKESDQSDGEMRKKLGESCGKKRGRPRKVQVEVEMKESDQSAEQERARGDCERREYEDNVVGKTSSHGDDPEKERAESETEKSKQSDGEEREVLKQKGESLRDPKIQGEAEMKESDQSDGEMRKKLGESCGKKRGRPRKEQVEVEMKESDQSADQLKNEGEKKPRKKCGIPSKMQVEVEIEESDQSDGYSRKKLKQNCGSMPGRHPLMQQTDGFLKVESDKENSIGTMRYSKSVLRSRDTLETEACTSRSFSESKRFGEELEMKMPIPPKGNNCGNNKLEDNESSFGSRSKAKTARRLTKIRDNEGECAQGKEGRLQRRAIQQAVRDRIVELLLSAGWKIEYRRRNSREYSDAVYVNPKGKTHWSVTLAYRMLKESYENGNDNSNSDSESRTGLKFIPIPDEELSVLKRVTSKERCDKNVSRKGKKMIIKKTAEGVTNKEQRKHKRTMKRLKIKKTAGGVTSKNLHKRKMRKEKLKAVMSSRGAAFKGRLKNNKLTHAQDNSACSLHGGTPLLARTRKRLESHNQNRCALIVRNSKEGPESDSDGYVLYDGKRTVLAWMMDLGIVPINGKVQCFNLTKTRVMLEGKIMKDGIRCDCCDKIFTVSHFQTHASGDGFQTFRNIYLESGCSLLQCLLDSWNKQDESEHRGYHHIDVNGEDPNDDTCGICGDGGDLICCDGCPSTFHQSCLDINFPSGDWCCIYCSCKFCGTANGSTYQGDDNPAATLLCSCCLCEEKYHHSCVQAKNAGNDDSGCESFCGKKCQELNGKLQRLLGVKHDLDEGFSWTLIRRYDVDSDRSLDDVSQKIECNSKLAVALYIMDECFLPMVDYRSGVNLIRNIIFNYGSNFKRLNYVGFVTAILEKDDEIVAAASIRIHGNQLAEMPFIGTRYTYRRQGMCRRLLSGVESALCALDVEKLVIPAISELRETWTTVFGFKPVDASLEQKLRNTNMLVFPGVDMLQKPISSSQETLLAAEGLKSAELDEHQIMNEYNNSDDRFSAAVDVNVSSEVTTPGAPKICDEPVAHESDSSLPPASLDVTSDITSENIDLPANACASDAKSLVHLSENPDDLEKKINTLGRACDFFEQAGDIGKQHNAIMVSSAPPHERIEALDTCPNQLGVPEVEIISSMVANIGIKAGDSERKLICTSKDATESVSCEVKLEDSIVKDSYNSHENITIKHDSDTVTQVSEDMKRAKHLLIEEFQVAGSLDLDGKVHDTCEVKKIVFQDVSVAGVAFPASAHDSSSCKINSMECPEAVVPPTPEDDCHIACGSVALEKPSLQTEINGSRRSTDIPLDSSEVTVGGELDLEKEPIAAQTHTLSAGEDSISGCTQIEIKSSKHLESDHRVPQTIIAPCNPESLCGSSSASGASKQCSLWWR